MNRMPEDLLMERKVELLVSMQTKELRNEVSDLKKVIVDLNSQVVEIRNMVKQQEIKREIAIPTEPEAEKTLEVTQAPPTPVESHAGGFTSDDVDIRKIFYCGNK